MKYLDEFRQPELARTLADALRAEARDDREYRLMEFCGGHTHAIYRYGIQDLVPPQVRYIHGPGCPVCVLPAGRIAGAIRLARDEGVILCTYADLMRVPAGGTSLLKEKAAGADIRMVYSTQDALKIARQNPDRPVVFLAIGFETTTPATAVAILAAKAEHLNNFSVYCNHVLTPAAMRLLLGEPGAENGVRIDGFLGPSHVSSVIGSAPYGFAAADYAKPVVIAGFEPLDVMQSTLMLIRQINAGRCTVENEYSRAVTPHGNLKAQGLMARVFETRECFEWRGLGDVPRSALRIRPEFAALDAEQRFTIRPEAASDVKGCECPAILRGEKSPTQCKLFGTVCTPDNPMGSCMVSSEGACAAHWTYGRFRKSANDSPVASHA